MKTQIAIAFQNGFKSIEAEQVTIWGIPFGIHRTPGRPGWSVTHIGTGIALQSGAASREKARQSVEDSVGAYGNEKVAAQLAAKPQAPPVNTLTPHVEPVKVTAPAADIGKLVEIVAKTVGGLTEREKAAVVRALNSRTGQLKSRAPSAFGDADEQLAAGAWQGLQPNGYKIGIVSVFSLRGEARELYEKLSAVVWPAAFDKDKLALVNAGVW